MKGLQLYAPIMKSHFRDFVRDEKGTTVEFVILFMPTMYLFFWFFETCLVMTRWAMLERGVSLTSRDLRLADITAGLSTSEAHTLLKARICDYAIMLPNCNEQMTLQLLPTNAATGFPTASALCFDRAGSTSPVTQIDAGSRGNLEETTIMFIRACAVYEPFFVTPYAVPLGNGSNGDIQLVASSAYVNEPE